MKFTIISVYHSKKQFGYDPVGYKIKLGGKVVQTYGDDYHEKGRRCSHAWVEGFAAARGEEAEINDEDQVDKKF